MTTETYYTLGEAAAMLKVHVQTLRRWIREQKLPARECGRQYRLTAADIEQLVRPSRGDDERDSFDDVAMAGLTELWDNEADAIYDDWKALYGVEEG